MKSRWSEPDARQYAGDLALRVYTSRLLGAEPSLVLHGGGNTSVKTSVTNLFGEEEAVLYVKGSGWDLETIEAAGFAPCRMEPLLRLAKLGKLSDREMAAELRKSLIDVNAPSPSVEAILHAILPARFVDHTHADAILALTNSPEGEQRVREVFGDRLVYIPYVMPGFKLARLCAELYPAQAGGETIGMLLLNHGLFTLGETAKSAYERMIELVSLAESYLAQRGARGAGTGVREPAASGPAPKALRGDIAALRKAVSAAATAPVILSVHNDADALNFVRRPDLKEVSQQGPATPDHVIRTKRVPLVGRDVAAYASAYREYFREHGDACLTMLDPAPRVILDPEIGLCTIGRTAKDAGIVEDIYRHTMEIIASATALGGWHALPARDIFEVEYWDLEQAKLRKGGSPPIFTGEVAIVTGAASGIGKACVASLLARGAAVVGLDRSPGVCSLHQRKDYLGVACDVTDEAAIGRALEQAVQCFGGVDMLILNAGVFPPSAPVSTLPSEAWRATMSINLDANLVLLRECHPLLKLAPRGGRVTVIGSKNVPAPGPGAAAYSASKAALQQLARVAALEWGADHIRINTLHPNAVFDTGIWTREVLASRAASYGLSVQEYKTNNVLKVEVTSRDVAELAAELCGPLFAKTTGAQIPVDGGTVRVV
ncbi:MAG: bifunctional aldolase/short-chain dehydrogenase [Steroidobacterales bacterium]|jgi:rhamnose utilization protein RhaD (predicted bifunctional aldolase and dehydrogenase)/NAD(P)-dependent dehydrogenase (short-subunit alcohol dehydrogenase family)